MIPGTGNCYPNTSQGIQQHRLYTDLIETSSNGEARCSETQLRSLLSSLSILKEKVHQVQSYAGIFISQENHQTPQPSSVDHESTSSMVLASMGTMIQEIIVTATSMMFNCQQMALGSSQGGNDSNDKNDNDNIKHNSVASSSHMQVDDDVLTQLGTGGVSKSIDQAFLDGENFYSWYADNITSNNNNNNMGSTADNLRMTTTTIDKNSIQCASSKNNMSHTANRDNKKPTATSLSQEAFDIVQLDAADLLAKYTHYCQVCGKGFKRDANLRMHMRAHGDEYKSSAALSNPLKKNGRNDEDKSMKLPIKYSCPHEGCRWNKKHVKFQPLKSIICAKNHYKRSHCPKMYVCKRCNRKQFSVLSDLRTHEKHCGDLKWQCSCGTTFSRKDKLMGHVALFIGHTPIINPPCTLDNKPDNQHGLQIHFKGS